MLRKRSDLFFVDNKYCPGCGHGVINRLIAEILEENNQQENVICSLAVGCACLLPESFGIDVIQAQHGRAAAVACGLKRTRPETTVFAYQGDGDASAIGLSETLYAAIRNENITVIFINNGIYGMTGGQMSPTSLPGQKTTTSPRGRDVALTGAPLNVIDLLQTREVAYLARCSVHGHKEINQTKKCLQRAFANQWANKGYSFVEILSPCPTNWKMAPVESNAHIKNAVTQVYPLGVFYDKEERNND